MKTISLYSIKGSVGKTASSVILAYGAARTGQRTLLLDPESQGTSSFYFRINSDKKNRGKRFLYNAILLSTDIEKMGMHCAPIDQFARASVADRAYPVAWNEIKNLRKDASDAYGDRTQVSGSKTAA
jgi:cellulose biosynthesis protein BcsQ